MVDPARYGITNPSEPVVHELPEFRYRDESVQLRVQIRKAEDGVWRGKLMFGRGEPADFMSTAEIFCAPSEPGLWDDIRGLRTHHFQDLYRSLVE